MTSRRGRRKPDPEKRTRLFAMDVQFVVETVTPESSERGEPDSVDDSEIRHDVPMNECALLIDEYGPWDHADAHPRGAAPRGVCILYPADSHVDFKTGESESTTLIFSGHIDSAELIATLSESPVYELRSVTAWVDVHEERDRLSIILYWGVEGDPNASIEIAEWWDDDARQMFEDGFFESGDGLEDSVIEYAMSVGLWQE